MEHSVSYGLKCAVPFLPPPPSSCRNPKPATPQNVIVFGDKDFKEVIKVKGSLLGWVSSHMTHVLLRKGYTKTQAHGQREDHGGAIYKSRDRL